MTWVERKGQQPKLADSVVKVEAEVLRRMGRSVVQGEPQPATNWTESLIILLTELHTYYVSRDDPNGTNWCMRVIAEAKEL